MTCPACGAHGDHGVVTVPDREYGLKTKVHYGTCQYCETCFQVPMPPVTELAGFYPEDYHSMGSRSRLQQFRHRIRLRRLLGLAREGATVLDYGCGDGSFLCAAADTAPQGRYIGYEIGSTNETQVLADGRVTLLRGSIEHLLQNLPELDLVTMNHVIEHLPDPWALISALRIRMAPGGVLEGQTPAAGSWEHKVFGRRWSGYHAPRHTVVFSRQGLKRVLERAGFTAIRIQGAFNPAGLAVSLGSLTQGDDGGRIRRAGPGWLCFLGLGTLLSPFDLFLGRPGIVNFLARKAEAVAR